MKKVEAERGHRRRQAHVIPERLRVAALQRHVHRVDPRMDGDRVGGIRQHPVLVIRVRARQRGDQRSCVAARPAARPQHRRDPDPHGFVTTRMLSQRVVSSPTRTPT